MNLPAPALQEFRSWVASGGTSDLEILKPIVDIVPVRLRVLGADEITDALSGKKRPSFRVEAIGAQAGVIYKSGRLIPKRVEAEALQEVRDANRQLLSQLGHPGFMSKGGIFGDIVEDAGIISIEDVTFDEKTGLVHISRITPTVLPAGLRLAEAFDSGIELGMSQRALGSEKWVLLPETDEEVILVESLFIVAYDFVHLANANAGDQTKALAVADSVIYSLLDNGGSDMGADAKQIAAKVRKTHGLASTIRKTTGLFRETMISRLGVSTGPLVDQVDATVAKVEAGIVKILDDESKTPDQAFDEMAAYAGEAQKLYATLSAMDMKPVTDAATPDPAAGDPKPEPKPGDAPKPGEKPTEPASSYTAPAAAVPVQDSLEGLAASWKLRAEMTALLDSRLKDLKHFTDVEREVIRGAVDLEKITDSASLEEVLKKAVGVFDAGKARAGLEAQGMKPTPATGSGGDDVTSPGRIQDNGTLSEVDRAHLWITDAFRGTGAFRKLNAPESDPAQATMIEIDDPTKRAASLPIVDAMLKRYDENSLKRIDQQTGKMWDLNGDAKVMNDAATAAADLVLPRTVLGRVILGEVFAMNILPAVTRQVMMDDPSQQIPIVSQWGRSTDVAGSAAFQRTYRPDIWHRAALQVGELGAINRGRTKTTFVNLDVVDRKLATALSVELLSRARRNSNLYSIAMTIQALVDDIRRAFLEEVFFAQILATSLGLGAVAFTFDNIDESKQLCDGTVDTFQVIGGPVSGLDPANAASIVPDDVLVVEEGIDGSEIAVPEYLSSSTGGGEGAAFWYTVDHANATITFVDATGASNPPPNAKSVLITAGNKSGLEQRFSMDAGAVKDSVYFEKLVNLIGNVRALAERGDNTALNGYDMNTLLSDNTSMESLTHAESWTAENRRAAVSADAQISEGNFGRIKRLAAWGSKAFSTQWMIIMASDAVIHGTYTPMELRGPFPTRNSSAVLTGGDEFYAWGEDGLVTPIASKIAPPITLYTP